MRRILQPFRFVFSILNIVAFLFTMAVVSLLIRDRWRQVRTSNRLLSYFCRNALFILNIRVNYIGLDNIRGVTNALYVGNHLSYIDVLLLSSCLPACFVTSTDIKNTPGLGLICKMAGCLFVDRRNKRNIHSEVAEMREGLERGLCVAVFPESTSTNGEQVLRFRRPLYVSAVDAEVPIVPFCVNYQSIGGQPLGPETRDFIFWYGDMDFGPHFWTLSGMGGGSANLHFMKPILVKKSDDARQLAEDTHAIVESVFVPIKKYEMK